jgi:hypothetical protein
MVKKKFVEVKDSPLLKLDLGCGKGTVTPDGFLKIDKQASPGVRVVDLRKRWPWGKNTVDEVHCGYLVNYLTPTERIHFVHELYRVLKPGAKATIITPYWAACAAYGDVTVQWPPVTEAWYPRLNKAWREAQNYKDPDGYTCNFEHTLGYGLHQSVTARTPEYQQHAVSFFKEAAQQLIATLIKA